MLGKTRLGSDPYLVMIFFSKYRNLFPSQVPLGLERLGSQKSRSLDCPRSEHIPSPHSLNGELGRKTRIRKLEAVAHLGLDAWNL